MKTPAEVKNDFIRQGVSVATWARDHGFNVFTVYRVLDGTLKGRRGISHEIAIELGLKEKPAKGKRAA
jgi:gp16 family phage-associated protein